MTNKLLRFIIVIPILISVSTGNIPIKENTDTQTFQPKDFSDLSTHVTYSNANFVGSQVLSLKSFSISEISPFITFKLYQTQNKLSLHLDGNGKPILIRNEQSFNKLFSMLSLFANNNQNIESIVIENAPGSILENFHYSSTFNSQPKSYSKISSITSEANKTITSPLEFSSFNNNSYIRNVTFTGFNTAISDVIRLSGPQNVSIFNCTFRQITVNSANFNVINIFYDIIQLAPNVYSEIPSTNINIYDNQFYSLQGNQTTTLISIEGTTNKYDSNIYIANNEVSNVSSNYNSATIVKIQNAYNVTFYNNSIHNINTASSFHGLVGNSVNKLNIISNNFHLIYAQDEIIGLNINNTISLKINNNNFNIFASTNGNVTGTYLSNLNSFNISFNFFTQLIASYDSFDFSNSKIVKGIVVQNSANSIISNNSLSQLSSKSKVYSMKLSDFSYGSILNNSISGVTSKSSSGIIFGGLFNSYTQLKFNSITNLVSSATDTIGISISYASHCKVQNNSIKNLESFSNLIGLMITNSSSSDVSNNYLDSFSTNSPVYDLYGIILGNSDNSIVSKNNINNYYSQLTFVSAITIEYSINVQILLNNITNCKSDSSSAFGILLNNDTTISISNNKIFNISSTKTSYSSNANYKIAKPDVVSLLAGGFGIFISLTNGIILDTNSINLTNYWLNADESVTQITFTNNMVDGTPLTFISLSHPLDMTFEQGSKTSNITWLAQDLSAYLYAIYVDSQLVSNGFWLNNVPIVFGVSDYQTLSLGQHEIQLILTDDKGHKITDFVNVNVVEFTPPNFTGLLTNKSILNGSLGNYLSWVAYDLNPGLYFLYRNDSLITSAGWTSNFPITASIDGLNIGTYNYTIIIKDSSLNKIKLTSFIFVLTNGSMLFNYKPNSVIISNFGSKNTTLNWIISSVQGGNYSIDIDGQVNYGTWNPDIPITFTLTNLDLGEHSVKFLASNSFTQIQQDLVVTVIIPQTRITNETSTVPSFSYQSSTDNILNIIKIDFGSLFLLILFIFFVGGTLGFFYYNRQKQYQSKNYVNKSERIEQLIEVGKAYIKMGNNLKAIKIFKQALNGATLINDVRLKAQIQLNLGYVGLQLKDESSIESSLAHLTEAKELSISIKDKTILVYCYSYLGDLYALTENSDQAINNYNESIKLAKELDDEPLEIQIQEKLGSYYHNLGQYTNAISCFDQGLILSKTIKDFKSEMNFNFYKGNSLLQQNDNDNAVIFYNAALKIAQDLNDITNQAKITGQLGRSFYQMGENESKAMQLYMDSINLAKTVGDLQIDSYQNRNIAIIQFENKKFDEARLCIDISLNFEKKAQFLSLKADCLIGQKDINQAIVYYKKALASAKKNDELQLEIDLLQKLSMIETKLLHEEKAIKHKKELDSILPEIDKWEKKLSSKKSKLKIIKSTRAEELIFTLISENIEPDPNEIEKIRRNSERLEKNNLREANKGKKNLKESIVEFIKSGGKKNE